MQKFSLQLWKQSWWVVVGIWRALLLKIPICNARRRVILIHSNSNQLVIGNIDMADTAQVEKVFSVLNIKERSLEEIEGQFLTVFSESYSVFNASYLINSLINLNLLTNQQRIIAIFLLIQNFKSEGIKKHPFGATILNISQKTTEPYERRMIADLVIENKRDRYSKFKIESLMEQAQTLMESFEERPEIKKLRDQFVLGLPKVSLSSKSEVQNILPDFNQKDKKIYSPDFDVNQASIKVEQISNQGFNVGFMRPLPQFLQISHNQYNWISPGIVSDLHWDNSPQIQKKITKTKALIKKGIDTHLNKDQATEIQRVLDQQTYAVLYLDVSPENMLNLIKNNPFVAVSILSKISNYPLITEYLQALLEGQMSLNSIDVISRLTKAAKISNDFLQSYATKIMRECQAIPQNHKDRQKLSKTIANFLKNLIKSKSINLSKYEQETEEFINSFIDIEEVQALKKCYKI